MHYFIKGLCSLTYIMSEMGQLQKSTMDNMLFISQGDISSSVVSLANFKVLQFVVWLSGNANY